MTELAVHHYGSDAADAPTLVLLHGFSDSGPSWAHAVRHWAADYRILAPDARGHGESPRFSGDDVERRHEIMVEDALSILQQAAASGSAPANLAGHSMGAAVAARAASQRPDLVGRLVLEDPPWRDEDATETARREDERRSRGNDTDPDSTLGVPASEDELARRAADGHRLHPRWPSEELLPWARAKAQTDPGMARARRRALPQSWPETASRLSVPTMLVTGDGAVLVNESVRARLEQIAPHIRIEVIPGADHCVRRDQGERYHEVVDPFLAGDRPD